MRISSPRHSSAANQRRAKIDAAQPSAPQDFHARSLTGLGFAHAANDTYVAFLPPLLPALIQKLSLSNTQAGLIAFASTSPSLLQPFIGYLADRADLRYVAILGPALAATGMSLLGAAPRIFVVALLAIIAGLGSAASHAVAAPIAVSAILTLLSLPMVMILPSGQRTPSEGEHFLPEPCPMQSYNRPD